MLIGVYQYAGDVTRSVAGATLINTIEVEDWPSDEDEFLEVYGGDFIQELEVDE